jgi:hypothetical protein
MFIMQRSVFLDETVKFNGQDNTTFKYFLFKSLVNSLCNSSLIKSLFSHHMRSYKILQ